ncbi:22481_t:CDS:2 [Racocetra persica]|uniref:22481_t:CDS:1 n=1 Tax=Racocetra persica TaxID=160502 RepID=A0ACA9MT08_9GLOM|nr:22481_t:CDS:2 [Racocetra persica]
MEDQNQQKKCQLCRKVVDILCDYTSVEGEKTENICQDCCGKIAEKEEEERKDKGYRRRKICRYCVREFPWDKDLDFLPAKQKVERELENHEHICPKKNDKSGKIRWDKKIKSVKAAKKQAVADSTYHKKIECGKNLTSYNIAVYFSPPQGGNKHADLIYADGIDKSLLTIEQDNQGEIYQEPVN